MENFLIKIADTKEEFQEIHRINYSTFVKEIPQHLESKDNILIDKFHNENTYIIAKVANKVVGMIAIRDKRPFSLDFKLENLDKHLPFYTSVAELRLLTIKNEFRRSKLFLNLIYYVIEYCLKKNYDLILISGIERELKLYKKIGLVPFSNLVGGKIKFQPMYLTKEIYINITKPLFNQFFKKEKIMNKRINFLPGPPDISENVKKQFLNDSVSHRAEEFSEKLSLTKKILCQLTNSNNCVLTMGSGTLANDMVAGGIKQLGGKGIIFAHGEFGSRLPDQAKRMGLDFIVLNIPEDKEFSFEMQKEFIESREDITWLWTVHLETSNGYVFDISKLIKLCKERSIELILDACSSAGLIECDFKDVYLASAVSGKGFLSYSGLSIVFYRDNMEENNLVPRYIDIFEYTGEKAVVPFTFSSNQLFALAEALETRPKNYKATSLNLRKLLKDKNLPLMGDDTYCKYVVTITLPDAIDSIKFGDVLRDRGVFISYESEYLIKKNRCQIVVLGNVPDELILEGIDIFSDEYNKFLKK